MDESMSDGLLVKSKRRADIEYALTILGLQLQLGTRRDEWFVGEIVMRHCAIAPKGTIILYRDDPDGTKTIETTMPRDQLGRGVSLLTTWGTILNVPPCYIERVSLVESVSSLKILELPR